MAEEIMNNNATDNQNEEQQNNNNTAPDDTNTPTLEDLMLQIAELQTSNKKLEAEKEKLKNIVSERNSDVANWKRKFQSTLSEQQQAVEVEKEAQEEHMREFERLQNFETKTLAEKRYLLQGMSAELAVKAAEAEMSSDYDALAEIQRKNTETLVKAKEAEWLASRPQPNTGTGEYSGMTKADIMAIKNPQERAKAIQSNLALF